jgi:hypothetical protein
MNAEAHWTRRSVRKLKVGDIISPEYNWAARIWKIYRGNDDQMWMILDPEVAKLYVHEQTIREEILGPHLFTPNQRPMFWEGPDDIMTAHKAARF